MNNDLWTLTNVTLNGAHRPRIDDCSTTIQQGITAVIGYSGAGKTSLLNLLTRFEVPNAGTIHHHPLSTANRLPYFCAPATGGLWPHLTVAEHLVAVAPAGGIAVGAANLLELFDLADKSGTRPEQLSQGEQSRLNVARALASDAHVLILDEPLVHVDSARSGRYWDVIREHCSSRKTSLVLATHSPELVLQLADNVACLAAGRLLYHGDVRQLYYTPPTPELGEFLGPANWLTPTQQQEWLGEPTETDRCFRPEQIAIEPSPTGAWTVESAAFAGSLAEASLRHTETAECRKFYHRPPGDLLHVGDRVLLKICALLLCCLVIAGCGEAGAGPILDVQLVRHHAMLSEGPTMPAPRGLTIGPNNERYVLDTAGRVLKYDAKGTLLKKWWMPDYDIGKPEGVCRLHDGRVAVADTHYHRVVFFDAAGKVVEFLGEYGTDPGQFIYPVAITQDDVGSIYVCEYGDNDRVQKFTAEGEFLIQMGSFGTDAGEFQRPSGIAWHAGVLYVVDAFNNRIQMFSDDGRFLGILGGAEQNADLNYPYDICKSANGELYVVEYGAGRVSKFDLTGRLLGRFGSTGTGMGQLATPWGLAVGPDGRVFVADTGNRRIVELNQ